MAKLAIKAGATSVLVRIFLADSSSTTGAGLTGLTSGTSNFVCYRARDDDGNAGGTAISLSGGTRGTWSSGGFVEKDSTNMPGVYEFGIPDNALATGSRSVLIMFKGATNLAPCPLEIDLDAQVDVTKWNGTAVASPATAGIPDVNVKNINNVAAATPGASGGIVIAGSNAATTFSGLTTGALSCTTITASGAVAFQSTFAVTTSTSLGAISGSTLTLSGAVAFQSTFAVTTSTSLGAVSGTTLTLSGAVTFQSTFATTGTTTFNAFTITNALTVSGATTLTGAVTGTNASNDLRINGAVPGAANGLLIAGSNAATTFATLTSTGAFTISGVSNISQTGDSFGRIGATGSGLTSLAPSATALSTVQWTNTLATNLGTTNTTVAANLNDTITSRMATYTQPTGFLAATFPTTVASTTNITAATGCVLSTAGAQAAADALLARNVAGGSSSGRIVSEALYALRNKVDMTTGTVFSVDDATPSWVFSTTTDAAALPITVLDPS